MRILLVLLAACSSAADPEMVMPEPDDGPSDGTLMPVDPPQTDSPHLALGVPIDGTPIDDHLVVHPQMAIGYSRFLNAANWVSWRTRPEDFGPVERYQGNFYPDAALPADWFRADHGDLYGSGYDRGHMLRSEERTRTMGENYDTFVMTNVLPQRADLNRGPWFDFELYVQRRVESSSRPRDAYVIAGPVWPAACRTHAARTAGDGCVDVGQSSDPARRIAVPEATWKVVVFVDAGEAPLSASDPYLVAVLMPNVRGIEEGRWWTYRTTVAAIEATSGYDLPSLQ
jgi:endonuclease G